MSDAGTGRGGRTEETRPSERHPEKMQRACRAAQAIVSQLPGGASDEERDALLSASTDHILASRLDELVGSRMKVARERVVDEGTDASGDVLIEHFGDGSVETCRLDGRNTFRFGAGPVVRIRFETGGWCLKDGFGNRISWTASGRIITFHDSAGVIRLR